VVEPVANRKWSAWISVGLTILIILSAASFAAGSSAALSGETVTILFTHDLHDHMLPVKDLLDGRVTNTGGFARLTSAILEEKRMSPDALLVDGGDFSMGTPFQTLFSAEAPELRLMGEMGYEVVTLGNHEFDYRAEGLAQCLQAAGQSREPLPQIIQSNTVFPAGQDGKLTPSLSALKQAYEDYGVKDYTILEKNGLKIGVFGLMGADAASNAPMSEVDFADSVENARRVVNALNAVGADLILCLSHSGTWLDKEVSEDEILAKEVPDIDVIISAHTHTRLDEPIRTGSTLIVSAEDSCRFLGKLKLAGDGQGGWELQSYKLRLIDGSLEEDSRIGAMVSAFKNEVQAAYFDRFGLRYDQVLAKTSFDFHNITTLLKTHQEDPLGNLISDAYQYAVEEAEGAEYIPVAAVIVPVGTIRGTFYRGDITTADAFTVSSLGIGADKVPGYPLISVYLTGKELKTVCEVDASITPMMEEAQLYMSGLNFTFNPHRLIFNKVTEAYLTGSDGSPEAIEDERLYRVVVGLYSAQMLSIVGDKSYGLLSIIPKTEDGMPIEDFETRIIHREEGGQPTEIKEWQAIAAYLQSFPTQDGIPQVPAYYEGLHGRKVIQDSRSLPKILQNPNPIALGIYGAGALALTILLVLGWRIVRWLKRRRRRRL
jgi:2',3'-cyclic-nucleotide 2'-phosphodiesterase (5'-nucleotidase family)